MNKMMKEMKKELNLGIDVEDPGIITKILYFADILKGLKENGVTVNEFINKVTKYGKDFSLLTPENQNLIINLIDKYRYVIIDYFAYFFYLRRTRNYGLIIIKIEFKYY
jgi:hypothetical protein